MPTRNALFIYLNNQRVTIEEHDVVTVLGDLEDLIYGSLDADAADLLWTKLNDLAEARNGRSL